MHGLISNMCARLGSAHFTISVKHYKILKNPVIFNKTHNYFFVNQSKCANSLLPICELPVDSGSNSKLLWRSTTMRYSPWVWVVFSGPGWPPPCRPVCTSSPLCQRSAPSQCWRAGELAVWSETTTNRT